MKQLFFLAAIAFIITFLFLCLQNGSFYTMNVLSPLSKKYWTIQSIDTMKYSRDEAQAKLSDASFDAVIDSQMAKIDKTGANYVAIGTPYDDQFLSYLTRWVKAARKYHLHIWFRGNFSGWEEWFGYAKIDRQTHTEMVKQFIIKNKDLFEDGDIFSSCPECENGADFNTSDSQQVQLYRDFLIQEYQTTKDSFATINKQVGANYYSMNGDIAKLVMDKETTKALGGTVVVDHYVNDPQVLADDLQALADKSGGQVVLGEFGAPIPDIHGSMTDEQQKKWIQEVLDKVSQVPQVIGVNYWVNTGGSTALWNDAGNPKPAVGVITTFYSRHKFF